MRVVALLPMKGNSERVVNKNLRDFCGRPLYHAVCNVLLASNFVTEIVVNTDSLNIAEDIRRYFPSISIIQRPEGICGDYVPMNEIIAYDLSQVDGDVYLQTHSTNPLISVETLDKAIDRFIKFHHHFDSLFSVTKLKTRLYWEDAKPINHNPKELLRTQDLPLIYEENSCFYIFSKTSFKSSGNRRIGLRPVLFEIDKLEAVDIDEPQDFVIAEQLYRHLRMGLL